MTNRFITPSFIGPFALAFALIAPSSVTAQEIKISRQFGLPYIPLMIMEQQHLLEKHVKLLGGGDVKTTWSTVGTSTAT
ncbi:MAG: hypothetical protein ABIS68_05120, partial [Casimicrobiaceae bacterium]